MIPNYQDRQIESSGVSDMASFGISQDDSAHIMNILRDTLYSDKVLAVLREYSANAWDAHNMVGKGDVPIKVVLPTHLSPTLIIKDYGPGLSHTEVFQVYTQYGASTKRASNVAVGQLGIGSKSGFAYSDSFTILSCNGGTRRTYVAVLDETEKGVINLLDESPCGTETGITIQIPIKPEDIPEFVSKAENLFKFFNPRPDINIYLPPEIPLQAKLKTGVIYDSNRHRAGEWLAVMGCIPYRLNLDQININRDSSDKTGTGYWVHKLSGVLNFDIGEVHISASREELKYSNSTKQTIVKRFTELADEFVTTTLNIIHSQSLSSWDKRLRCRILTNFDLPIPDDSKKLATNYIDIQEKPENFATTFQFLSKDESCPVKRVYVGEDTRIVLVDDTRKMAGFRLDYHDLMLHKKDAKYSWEEVLKELGGFLIIHLLDGIPVTKLSEQTWIAPFVKHKAKKVANPKYFRRSFVLTPSDRSYCSPLSRYWEPTQIDRVATDKDVFVLLDGFKTEGPHQGFDLYNNYKRDKRLVENFGMEMPSVYGYKTSEKKPLKISDCAGISYQEWQKKIIAELVEDKAKPYIEIYDWFRGSDWSVSRHHINMRTLGVTIGRTNSIYQYFNKVHRAHKLWRKLNDERKSSLITLGTRYFKDHKGKSESQKAMKDIRDKYPLLDLSSTGFNCLWGANCVQWGEYVKLVDHITSTGGMTFTPVEEKKEDEDNE